MYTDRLRSRRWHQAKETFRLIAGPFAQSIDIIDATIEWEMSEVCSGQVEWGLTTAYGNTTTLQSITGGYARHVQSLTPLAPVTTYHYRTKSTSAAGVTVYSADQSVTTLGVPLPSGGVGPRYGKSTWPSRTTTEWPSLPASYVLVDATVPTDGTECSSALTAFLNNTTKCPDGSVIVFDKTLLGAGTTYTLNKAVMTSQDVLRSNLTFWAYNTTFRMSAKPTITSPFGSERIFYFRGGLAGCSWLGGEIYGPNAAATSDPLRSRALGPESNHALDFACSWQDLTVMDVYIHNVGGDGIQINKYDAAQADNMYDVQGAPADLEIGYCLIRGTGRQGIVPNQGTRVNIHHNIVEYIALYPIDAEDNTSNFNVHIDTTIADNVFRYWTTTEQAPVQKWNPRAISYSRRLSEGNFGTMSGFLVARNIFEGGAYGYGNPTQEAIWTAAGLLNISGVPYRPTEGYGEVIAWSIPGMPISGCTVEDNVFDLPANQDRNRSTGIDYTKNGNAVEIDNCTSLVIQGNDFGARGVYYRNCPGAVVTDVTGIVNGT